MISGFYPYFNKGRVLKKESVEYLRDFPHELASMEYDGFSSGVLYGFKVYLADGNIHIGNGVLKHKGDIILVNENTIAVEEYGQLLIIRLYVGRRLETEDYRISLTEVNIDKRGIVGDNEIELGRFSLNRGAELRIKYDSYGDLRTIENTLDLTHVAYAGLGAPTLHPVIMKEFGKAALESFNDKADIAFALMCLNMPVVHKNVIQWYLAKRNNTEYKEYMLPVLYEKLYELLPEYGLKNKHKRAAGRGPIID